MAESVRISTVTRQTIAATSPERITRVSRQTIAATSSVRASAVRRQIIISRAGAMAPIGGTVGNSAF